MLINVTRKEVRRILGALQKAEEWDECDAQSLSCNGKPRRGWTKEYRLARASQAANLALQSKLRDQLK